MLDSGCGHENEPLNSLSEISNLSWLTWPELPRICFGETELNQSWKLPVSQFWLLLQLLFLSAGYAAFICFCFCLPAKLADSTNTIRSKIIAHCTAHNFLWWWWWWWFYLGRSAAATRQGSDACCGSGCSSPNGLTGKASVFVRLSPANFPLFLMMSPTKWNARNK